MNRKDNLRAQSTRRKLRETLLQLLGAKPLKGITVQALCRAAEINRTTFYIHYDGLYDLMRDIEVEMQHGVNRLFMDAELGVYKPFTDRSLEQLLAYIHEHADFYRILLNDLHSLNLLDGELAAAWKRGLEPVLRKRPDSTEAELQYRFEYFNSGFRGIVRKWLNAGCPESPRRLAQIIKNTVQV